MLESTCVKKIGVETAYPCDAGRRRDLRRQQPVTLREVSGVVGEKCTLNHINRNQEEGERVSYEEGEVKKGLRGEFHILFSTKIGKRIRPQGVVRASPNKSQKEIQQGIDVRGSLEAQLSNWLGSTGCAVKVEPYKCCNRAIHGRR